MRLFNKSLLLTLTVLLLLVTITSSALATEVVLTVTPVKQAQNLWCWAAVAEMIGKQAYPSSTRNQYNLCYHVFGNTNNQTASMPDTAHAANYMTYDTCTYWSTILPWSWTSAKEEIIDQGQAYGAMVEWKDSAGNSKGYHMYAVYGANDSTYQMKFVNPLDAESWWMSWDSFKNGGTISGTSKGYLYGEVYRPF